ncbi:MAG: hypothetical protein ING73_11250 [Rhodocyclaceae bacterium]|nr:hypothetical protein [Rhodocyclaceae bacterium]
MKASQIAKTLFEMLPQIIGAVKAIEAALPDGTKGEDKLIAVREVLEAGYQVAEDKDQPFALLWPAIQNTVAALVRLFNKTGVFKPRQA